MQPRAKLSLRRNKKQSQTAVPHAELSVSSSNATASQPLPLPPTPSGVVAERVDSASGHVVADLVERDCVSRAHGNRGSGGGEVEDFKPPQPLARTGRAARGRKRKRQNIDSSSYLEAVGQEELQLAMALSGSLHQQTTPTDPAPMPQGKRGTRGRTTRANERDLLPASVLATSPAESQKILAQRASDILQENEPGSSPVPAPSLPPSQLAERVSESQAPSQNPPTMWEMAGYPETERQSKFYVPALDLPFTEPALDLPFTEPALDLPFTEPSKISDAVSEEHPSAAGSQRPASPPNPSLITQAPPTSRSPQPSQKPHTHISSSQPSQKPHTHISSSQPSQKPHTHISSLQPSQTPPSRNSRSPQPSQPAPTHPSPPPVLPRGVQGLLSPQPSQPAPTHPSPPPVLPRGVQRLLSDYSSLVGSQLCSDVIISTGDGRGIPAHSAILACRCPMLAERLFQCFDKPVHLDFSQFDRATVVSFLRYLYTGTVPHRNGMGQVTMLALSLGMVEMVSLLAKRDHTEQEATQQAVMGSGASGTAGEVPFHAAKKMPSPDRSPPELATLQYGMETSPDVVGTMVADSALSPPHSPVPERVKRCRVIQTPKTTPSVSHETTPTATPTLGSPSAASDPVRISSPDIISITSSPPASPPPPPSLPPHTTSPQPRLTPPSLQEKAPLEDNSSSQEVSYCVEEASTPPEPLLQAPADSPASDQLEIIASPTERVSADSPELEMITSPAPLRERIASSAPTADRAPSTSPLQGTVVPDRLSGTLIQNSEPQGSSYTESNSFNWNVSWEVECEATRNAPKTPAGNTWSEGTGVVAVAVYEEPSQEQVILTVSATPQSVGQRLVPESDIDVTPMPDYQNMATPHLKEECSRFGVRALPKRKMITKLKEIYDYTHPLAGGTEVAVVVSSAAEAGVSSAGKPVAGEAGGRAGRGRGRKGKVPEQRPPSSQHLSQNLSMDEVVGKVREVITTDTELYEDMLLYKPLELTHIQSRLKAAALSLSKERLMDVLDHLCVTFSVPRQHQQQRTM